MTGERLLLDRVPMEVNLPDGSRHLRARVFVTDQRVQVWTEARPPVLAYEQTIVETDLASVHASAGTPSTVTTADGQIRLSRARGACSCQLPGLMGLSWPTS